MHRWAQRLPPWGWLVVAMLSLLLALGSGLVLVSRLSDRQKDEWVRRAEAVRQFGLETYRQTFLKRLPGADANPASDVAVHVAPHGTLDPAARLAWVDHFEDFAAAPDDDAPPAPVAPPKTLDPDWKPTFQGAFSDT